MFHYLWDEKPDKINRIQVCKDYLDGGLKMINIEAFIKSLQSTWIRRLCKSIDTPWANLFKKRITTPQKIMTLGPYWLKISKSRTKNKFWQDVLDCTYDIMVKIKLDKSLCYIPIWYNNQISTTQLFYPHWYNKGIHFIGDILGENNEILSQIEISNRYSIRNINFLEYFRLSGIVKSFIKKQNINIYQQTYIRPFFPIHIQPFLQCNKGVKNMYLLLNDTTKESNYKEKWTRELDIQYDNNMWRKTFRSCFNVIKDNRYIWFQFRLIHRILGTRNYRFRLNMTDSPMCVLCDSSPETLMHLFVECQKSKILWQNLKTWIESTLNRNFEFTKEHILLGYNVANLDFVPINSILMITKYYIFCCALKRMPVDIFKLQYFIKDSYNEQKLVAATSFNLTKFNKNWLNYNRLFV